MWFQVLLALLPDNEPGKYKPGRYNLLDQEDLPPATRTRQNSLVVLNAQTVYELNIGL